jgi:protein-L-isoaspartate(D-aspartate) O-methyltransferase
MLLDQLAEDGILVIPVGNRESQQLEVIQKKHGQARVRRLVECAFVPLQGKQGW